MQLAKRAALIGYLLGCGVDDRAFDPIDAGVSAESESGGTAGATGSAGSRAHAAEDAGAAAPEGSGGGATNGGSAGNTAEGGCGGACACTATSSLEVDCSDTRDDDCDGQSDCEDPDCAGVQCGVSDRERCCDGACVDTGTDRSNCQGCGLGCAAAEECVLISDESGTRGHCTCFASSDCPGFPNSICRKDNGDGQDDLCACDFANALNAGCAEGQVCADVLRANFCRYP